MTAFRLAGVPVVLHSTFLVVVVVWGGWMAWEGGLALLATFVGWVGVYLVSVLAHEMGHALAAARFGIPTRRIIILPIGGAAQLEARRVRPWVDVVVSSAGPAASLVLAVVFLAAWLVTGWVPLAIAGAANALNGLFNLLPALPMDGGRVFRALLVRRVGLARGTRIALAVGIAFAVFLGLLGLVYAQIGLVAIALVMGVLQWREHQLVLARPQQAVSLS